MNPRPSQLLFAAAAAFLLTAVAIPAATAASTDIPPTNAVRLTLDLHCGSRLIGTPSIRKIPLLTKYGRLEIPLSHIETIDFNNDRETARFSLRNEDLITGIPGIHTFDLSTIVGDLSIGTETIRRVGTLVHTTLASGLVLYYPFDNDEGELVLDRSGQKNHGKAHGPTPVADRLGTPGAALHFDGSSYVDVANSPSLGLTDAVTVAAWVKVDAVDTPGYVVAKGDFKTYAITIPEWPHFPHGDKDFVTLLGEEHLNAACPLAEWTHIAFTYARQAGVVCQYVDGTLRAQHPYTEPVQTNDANLQIGRRLPGSYYFNGSIDELRIYNRALPAEQIAELHAMGGKQ